MDSESLRYPIGPFAWDGDTTVETRATRLAALATAPHRLAAAVEGLDDRQLDTPYREGGWTVRQVVHHVADSHLNGYLRLKLALTEDVPTIKAYDQPAWAELLDARTAPVGSSLALLAALHQRWMTALSGLGDGDLQRSFVHPEVGRAVTVHELIALYAWHGRHHTAHIEALRARRGW